MYLGGSRRWVPRPVVSSCAQIVLQYFFLIAAHYYKEDPEKTSLLYFWNESIPKIYKKT